MDRTPTFGDEKSLAAKPLRTRKAKPVPESTTFPLGSLAAELLALGEAVPTRAWAKLPRDYFGNIDRYLRGSPKNK
jgi:hypothetical protein